MASGKDIKRAILAAVGHIKDETSRAEVVRALESGDVQAAIDAVKFEVGEDLLADVVPATLRTLFEEVAGEARDSLSERLGASVRFDIVNPSAVEFVREEGADLIREFGEASQEGIRTIVEEMISSEVSPSRAADLIVDSGIGLTENQADRVLRYREGLVEEDAWNAKEVDALTEAFSQRLLEERADVIAHTEEMRATREGNQELWGQAREQGLLGDDAVQEWQAETDPCDECAELDGEQVGLGQEFPKGGGKGPPLHPRCKCGLRLLPFGGKD